MNTITIKEKLRNIDTIKLSQTMGVGINMAGKYKNYPEKYTPNAIQAQNVFEKHKIPVKFWKDIKSFLSDESIATKENNNKPHNKKVTG